MNPGDVGAVVVNYESGAALARCVKDLGLAGVADVVVVDNGSSDGSLLGVDVPVVTPPGNLGYGSAVNRGAACGNHPLILVANPDLEVSPDCVAELVAALDSHPAWAMVGPLIRTSSGGRYPSARRFPSFVDAAGHALLGLFAPDNRFTRNYQQPDLEGVDPQEVDWVSGACQLVRRAAFEEVGGFDEAYFMYAEDVDLCWRLHRAGWGVGYVPSATVVHAQGISTAHHPYRMVVEHQRSLWRFARVSTSGANRLALPLVAAGLVLRAGLAMAVVTRNRVVSAKRFRLGRERL